MKYLNLALTAFLFANAMVHAFLYLFGVVPFEKFAFAALVALLAFGLDLVLRPRAASRK